MGLPAFVVGISLNSPFRIRKGRGEKYSTLPRASAKNYSFQVSVPQRVQKREDVEER